MRNTAAAATKRGIIHTIIGVGIWLCACSSSTLKKPTVDASTGTDGILASSGGASGHGGSTDVDAPSGNGGWPTGSGGASGAGSGGTLSGSGGAAGATVVGPGTGGGAGSTMDAATAGAGGRQPDAGIDTTDRADVPVDVADAPTLFVDGGSIVDGGWGEVGSALADFCVGSQSKVLYAGKTYEASATTKWTDPFLSCCQVYAARVHTSEAVGQDFEVVVSIRGNIEGGGVIPVPSTWAPIMATLRTSSVSNDAAVAKDSVVTGSVFIGGRPLSDDAWTLGACLSVDDPASPFSGTQVYVPGVPVAPHGWASRLRFLPLSDSNVAISSVETKDLQSLQLANTPLLDLMDIDYVDADTKACSENGQAACNWVGLNTMLFSGTTLASKVTSSAPGMPFVVEADGERIYLGVFQSIISAYAPRVARVGFEDILADGFPIYPPRAGTSEPDLRNDPRILKVLSEAGKLIP